jgi:hypothetical protein
VSTLGSGHVSSDRLGEAAQHASLEGLRDVERRHVEGCERCKRLYAGYRLTDRLLASSWRQAALPASALEQKPIRTGVAGMLDGFMWGVSTRSLVPIAVVSCLVLALGFGVLLPRLVPMASPSASANAALSSQNSPAVSANPGVTAPSSGASADASGEAQQSPGSGQSAQAAASAATPAPPATPAPQQLGTLAALPGWPVVWSPDGAHLLVIRSGFGGSGQVQIRTSSGALAATLTADNADWFDSNTVAIATHGRFRSGPEAVTLINLKGQTVATLPGGAGPGAPFGTGSLVLGSGTGLVAVTSAGGWTGTQAFVVWDGQTATASHPGIPIAFSRDGARLAILHPAGGPGGGFASGYLEIVSVPGLQTIASLTHTTVRLAAGNSGPGFDPDAAFSPDGNWLLVAGTLVDLSRGSAVQAGEGGWLPDGTLITASGGGVLRWQGPHATPDTRFAAGGSIATSVRGDVAEFFGDGRKPLLLAAGGAVAQLQLPGIASLDGLLLAPNGGAVAVDGKGTNGSRVTAVAPLK